MTKLQLTNISYINFKSPEKGSAVERMLSISGDIFKLKRRRLEEVMFSDLVLKLTNYCFEIKRE